MPTLSNSLEPAPITGPPSVEGPKTPGRQASSGSGAQYATLAAALLGQMPLAAVRERLARAATGPDFQLGLRLTPEGYGITVAEARETARTLLATGLLDFLDMSLWDVTMRPRDTSVDGLLIEHFSDLPRHGTLLGVAGGVTSAEEARWCLEQGADFVTVGIAAILHHDFAARSLADPAFRARQRPVPAADLRAEHVGPAFIDYLAAGWDDLIA